MNDGKMAFRLRASSARLFALYLGAFTVCIGVITFWERQIQVMAAAHKDAAPPPIVRRRAEEIMQALFVDAPPAVIEWISLTAQRPAGGAWMADIRCGENSSGRLVFEGNGRLRLYSCPMARRGTPIRRREDALAIARAKIRSLHARDWYDCYLTEEAPFRQPGQTGGSWYVRGQKPRKRILLTLDARTGGALYFSETTVGSSKNEPLRPATNP